MQQVALDIYPKPDIELMFGDCLNVMSEIPDGSIDMVMADPPYGTTACKWDSVIPLGPMWEQLKRVVKPNGAIVLTGSQPFTSVLIMGNIDMFKYSWVWRKTIGSGFVNCKNRPITIHEDVCVFSHGTVANRSNRLMIYNPQGIQYNPYHKKRLKPMTAKKGGVLGQRPSHVAEYDVKYTNYPKSVIDFSNPNNSNVHPTQKPVALMEYLIKTYTNEGETVLDFCMGSGTTGVACKNLNRNFIGIEKDPEYFEIAEKRINEAI